MFDRVVGMVLQLALVPILAAHWGLERYGVWGMLIALPGLLLLTDLGFATAATVRMTMQIAKGQREAARVSAPAATTRAIRIFNWSCARCRSGPAAGLRRKPSSGPA